MLNTTHDTTQPTVGFYLGIALLFWPSLSVAQSLAKFNWHGLNIATASAFTVQSHMQNLGGFKAFNAQNAHQNWDKFYPIYRDTQAYSIEFVYSVNGQVERMTQLLRQTAVAYQPASNITTQQLAQQLIPSIGQPNQVRHIHRLGKRYQRFIWRNDDASLTIDHQQQNPFFPLIIEWHRQHFISQTSDNNDDTANTEPVI